MKKDFNATLPKTDFTLNFNGHLEKENVTYRYELLSNLAKLTSFGTVVPTPLKMNVAYEIDVKELALLRPITNAPLRGSFKTNGTIEGSKKSLIIEGDSDLGGSDATYKIDLKEFKPRSVMASVKGAKVSKLLHMTGQPSFAFANLDVDVKLTSLEANNLAGRVSVTLKNGLLNSKVMKDVYSVNVPKTTFASTTQIELNGKNVNYQIAFNSNLAKFNSNGLIIPQTMKVDLKYDVDIKELAGLKPITGMDVRGKFKLSGKAKGDEEKLLIDGKSDFASSDTTFSATLKDFVPSKAKIKMKNLQLAKVFHSLKQPRYASGVFSLNADLTDARSETLKGVVTASVKKGVINSKYLTKTYKFNNPMPRVTFDATTRTTLNKNLIDAKVVFTSNLATLQVKKARFNLKDSSILSDYELKLLDLNKTYFITDRRMKGSLTANGEFKKAKNLELTVHSKIAGGTVDAKLRNDDLRAQMKSLQTLELLRVLTYPEIFKSSLNGVLNYRLASKKGTMKADLTNGKFTQNSVLDLAKRYASANLYKETFKGDSTALINGENIVASLDLKSNKSSISTKNAKLNSKTKKINSKIELSADGKPLTVTLKGNANSPSVSVNAEKLIYKEAEKAVTKEINKFLKGFF